MGARDDALVKAAHEFLRIQDIAAGIDGAVATVGQVELAPGGANVIPDRVGFSIDARAPDIQRLERLIVELGLVNAERVRPCQFSAVAREALHHAVREAGLPTFELPSGAGHHAGIMQQAGVQAAMLFVRAQNDGASSPRELALDDDLSLAVDVLTRTLSRLSRRTQREAA